MYLYDDIYVTMLYIFRYQDGIYIWTTTVTTGHVDFLKIEKYQSQCHGILF